MSEWRQVRLGEVTEQVRDAIKPVGGHAYPLLGVKWYAEGPFLRETVTAETSKATTLYRVTPGQFIYNRMFAWKGAFGLVGEDLAGSFVSNEFPLFECDAQRLMAEFLVLHFRQPWVWDEVALASTGTTASRSRWKESLFADYTIAIPPVSEQRRIVDLMAALDAQIEALESEARAVMAVWSAQVAALDDADTRMSLGEGLLSIEAGKSPKGEARTPLPGERAVLKISAVQKAHFDPSQVKTVPQNVELPASSLIRKGDILFVRCNALLERVGVVCQVPNQPEGLYLCDKTLRLVPDTNLLRPDYLSSAMSAPSVRRQIEERTAGSDMRNIGQKAIREISVPVVSLAEQRTQADALTGLVRDASAVEDELNALQAFRSALLPLLLNHSISIPESYDALLGQGMGIAS